MINEEPKSLFREHAATISWIMALVVSYAKSPVPNHFVELILGGLMLLGFLAGIAFGVVGVIEYKQTRNKLTLVQAIIGILLNAFLFLTMIIAALDYHAPPSA